MTGRPCCEWRQDVRTAAGGVARPGRTLENPWAAELSIAGRVLSTGGGEGVGEQSEALGLGSETAVCGAADWVCRMRIEPSSPGAMGARRSWFQ